MQVHILGPLEVWGDGERVGLGGGRQRALLALLVLHRGEVVSVDRLIDELWAGHAPATAAKVLQNLVSQLRRALGSALRAAGRRTRGDRNARVALRDELGLEPSRSLRQLEQAILAQDPALGEPARLPPPPARRRRRMLVPAAAGLLVALAIGVGWSLRGGSSVDVLPRSVVKIDPGRNEIVDSIGVGDGPGEIRVLGRNVFVTSVKNKTLTRIDASTGETRTSGEHAAGPGIAAAPDQLWVASETRGEVTRVSPRSLSALERIRLAGTAPGDLEHALVALGGGSLWVSEYAPSAITRWSLRTHGLIRSYKLGALEFPVEITFGEGAAWVPLFRVDQQHGPGNGLADRPDCRARRASDSRRRRTVRADGRRRVHLGRGLLPRNHCPDRPNQERDRRPDPDRLPSEVVSLRRGPCLGRSRRRGHLRLSLVAPVSIVNLPRGRCEYAWRNP